MKEDKKENKAKEDEKNNDPIVTKDNIIELIKTATSEEVKIFFTGIMDASKKSSRSNIRINIAFMVLAFACIGMLAYLKLMPEGTTGVLAGIIIGHFFKKND